MSLDNKKPWHRRLMSRWHFASLYTWADTVKTFAQMRMVSWRFWGYSRGTWFIGVIHFQPSTIPPDPPVTEKDRKNAEKWRTGFVAAQELTAVEIKANNSAWSKLK